MNQNQFQVQKNDKALKELQAYSTKVGLPLRDVLLSDEHLVEVSGIFYKHMPKMVRFVMKQASFQEYYKNHREKFVSMVAGL